MKLDFRNKPHGHVISAAEVEQELKRVGHSLQPFEIVLMNTSAGAAYGTPEYIHSGCGFGREATLYLLGRGVRIVGTDAWSWDVPFSFTRERFARDGDPSIAKAPHQLGVLIVESHVEQPHTPKRKDTTSLCQDLGPSGKLES